MPSTSVLPTQDMQHQINQKEKRFCCLQRFLLKTRFFVFGVGIYNDVQKTHSRHLKYISQDQISLAIILS